MKREALIVSLLLLVAGYLVGAMLSSTNPRHWPEHGSAFFALWFVVCVLVGALLAYGRDAK